jgi:hypothetical protein
MSYKKCVTNVSTTLHKRGFENHEEVAASMCNIWADENGVEREFGRTTSAEPKRRSFGITFQDGSDFTLNKADDGEATVTFPVIAITSGPHDYEEDGIEQRVHIEPSMLTSVVESFDELPIYVDHQRTSEDLIGMATDPQVIEMDNGKTAIKMLATVSSKYNRGNEAMEKVKDGDMTHVSIDWFSNDIDVMGDTFATNIRPTEVSFIDNEKMDPVCKECTIDKKEDCDSPEETKEEDCDSCCDSCKDGKTCDDTDGTTEVETMSEEQVETNVKSDAEEIVEREFASLKSQLQEAQATIKEQQKAFKAAESMIAEFKEADEKRAEEEAVARKNELVKAVISREVLLGTLVEDKAESRVEELSAWDESRLTGFSDALAVMPEPAEVERSFGKGKASADAEVKPEDTERKFGVKWSNGKITLDREVLRGD